jgi:2'-5' RNA ligase
MKKEETLYERSQRRVKELKEEVARLTAEIEQYKETEDFNPPITCVDCCRVVRNLSAELEEVKALKVKPFYGENGFIR